MSSLWAKLPSEYKLAASLEEFKVKIKKWKCDTCDTDYAKNFNQILGLLIRNIVSKIWIYSVLLQLFKKIKKFHYPPKKLQNYY